MPKINLIEEQRLAIKRDERTARTYFALFGGVAAGSLVAYGTLAYGNTRAATSESKLKAAQQAVAPLMRKIDADATASDALKPRLETLQEAQATTLRWSRILHHVASQTPPEAWLTNLHATNTDPAKPITASFLGDSRSQAPVSQFLFRLENSPDLENVNLKYTQEKDAGQVKQTEFEIDADVVGTAEKKAPEKKA